MKSIDGIVRFYVKMQVNYDASNDLQNGIIDYRCFPRILENWLSTFFKNNFYSEKNSANKYMLKIN